MAGQGQDDQRRRANQDAKEPGDAAVAQIDSHFYTSSLLAGESTNGMVAALVMVGAERGYVPSVLLPREGTS